VDKPDSSELSRFPSDRRIYQPSGGRLKPFEFVDNSESSPGEAPDVIRKLPTNLVLYIVDDSLNSVIAI